MTWGSAPHPQYFDWPTRFKREVMIGEKHGGLMDKWCTWYSTWLSFEKMVDIARSLLIRKLIPRSFENFPKRSGFFYKYWCNSTISILSRLGQVVSPARIYIYMGDRLIVFRGDGDTIDSK